MQTINKILTTVLEINEIEGIDSFFNFSGHVNRVDIYILRNAKYISGIKNERVFDKDVQLEDKAKVDDLLNELIELKYKLIDGDSNE